MVPGNCTHGFMNKATVLFVSGTEMYGFIWVVFGGHVFVLVIVGILRAVHINT